LKISKKKSGDESSQQHCMLSSKKGKTSTKDFIRGVNSQHYAHSHKKVSAGACQWHLQELPAQVSNMSK
jgi:hypothetical protein